MESIAFTSILKVLKNFLDYSIICEPLNTVNTTCLESFENKCLFSSDIFYTIFMKKNLQTIKIKTAYFEF